MSDWIDWTTTKGCPRCNEHGPYLPHARGITSDEDLRELHQAWHEIVAALIDSLRIVRMVEWLDRRLAR